MTDLHRKQLENLGKIKVVEVKDNKDGSTSVIFDVKKEFITAYKDLYHLAEWDQGHFEQTFNNAIEERLLKECKKNEQNPDFLWSLPKDDNE